MLYYGSLYEPNPKGRLFYFTKHYLLSEIKRVAKLAVAEIFQAGYLEICSVVYCLASRELPLKYL